MNKAILILLSFLFALSLSAQRTGSFQETISFEQADYPFTRTLYYYVPLDYDNNKSYKVVVGFRGGPHSSAGQFRDQLQFLSDSIGAIILCPENSSHFNNQEGLTKKLFEYSLDTLMNAYNIDEDYIYLTGLSYGGRHAVIVSMDTDDGPLAKLRGVIPFATGRNAETVPNYDQIQQFPPACICIGLNDNQIFKNVAQTIHQDIQDNNGHSMLNEIPGIGHTVAFATYPQEMMKCINYIESVHETTTSISDLSSAQDQWMVYPNPSRTTITLEIKTNIEVVSLKLLASDGRMLKELKPTQRIIDLSSFGAQSIFLSVETKDGVSSKRVNIGQ